MAHPKRRKTSKRRGRIKLSQRARIVEKNDKTRVSRPDTSIRSQQFAETPMPRSNGAVFKIKVKRR